MNPPFTNVFDPRLESIKALENRWLERWYLKPRVRILIVSDQGISLDSSSFGLKSVLDTLLAPVRHYDTWVRFRITGATREGGGIINPGRDYSSTANPYQFKFEGFRFDMPGFDLNQYDQVWFFGFRPGNDGSSSDASVNLPANLPLTDNELKILSHWMNERGGGVFATGDHHYLGASLCSRIPRVRNMRRWTNAQNVPPIGGNLRHDTNQPKPAYTTTIPFDAQNDDTPQTVEVLRRVYSAGAFKKTFVPHPVLCGVDGVIEILPDHPHEGETLGKRFDGSGVAVDTSGSLSLAGYNFAEYPDATAGGAKPEPVIIALGHPVNTPLHVKNQSADNPSHANETVPFGLITAYDGALAGIGRVLVDSTWHHWFNTNLTGLSASNPAAYRQIQNYFINVAVWLSNDALRRQMLMAATWGLLVVEFDPMRFSIKDSIWTLGVYARDVLGRRASRCTTTEWILDLFDPHFREGFVPIGPDPCLSCPSFEVFEVAILGGILKQLLPLVEKCRLSEQFERRNLPAREIEAAVLQGVELGRSALKDGFQKSLDSAQRLVANLPKLNRKLSRGEFVTPIQQATVVFRVEQIFVRDPLLQHVLSGRPELLLVVNVNGIKQASHPLKLRVAEKGAPGGLRLVDESANKGKGVLTIDEGEVVELELYAAEATAENRLWSRRFEGDPQLWVGNVTPELNPDNPSGLAVWVKVAKP